MSRAYQVDATLSIRFGKEVFAAYGGNANNDKKIAFFGNTILQIDKFFEFIKI